MRSRVNSIALAMKTRFEHSSRMKGLVRKKEETQSVYTIFHKYAIFVKRTR